LRERPFGVLEAALALSFVVYVVMVPFFRATYPPIVDLPFHAAQTSILRHYLDESFHFREQFSLHPIEVPYLTMYGIGALVALFVPITAAAKVMSVVMLLLMPVGLAVLFHGMKKSPALGLLSLGLVWCTLTHWGFLNFLGALGLYAMSVGFALLVVDRPTPARLWGLSLSLVGVFFTHIYRLPFAVLSVLLAGALCYPATRRFRPLLAPLLPSVLLFAVWWFVRPETVAPRIDPLGFDISRLIEIPRHLFGAYAPPEGAPATVVSEREAALGRQTLGMFGAIFALTIGLFFAQGRARGRTVTERRWAAAVTALPLLLGAGLLFLYLTLPLEMGLWWYVFPREIIAATFLLLAVVPDLPKGRWHRIGALVVMLAGAAPMSSFVGRQWKLFDEMTADFKAIVELVPATPRLFYLIYRGGGTERRVSPFLHLPAWIQAHKGGALAFHFVSWNHSPIRYRRGSPSVPPELPPRFEWTPQYFRVLEHGAWFDTFLVRHDIDPSVLFAPDPTVRLVGRRGMWWLYRRTGRPGET
jgi:hypothetical protein